MLGPIVAVVRGMVIGLAGAIGGGLAACVGTITFGPFLGESADPAEKARHLAEAISAAMHVSFMLALVAVPVCVAWSVYRSWRVRRALVTAALRGSGR